MTEIRIGTALRIRLPKDYTLTASCLSEPLSKPNFMADWLVFQATERQEREAEAVRALLEDELRSRLIVPLQYSGKWPPKVGLEFPR